MPRASAVAGSVRNAGGVGEPGDRCDCVAFECQHDQAVWARESARARPGGSSRAPAGCLRGSARHGGACRAALRGGRGTRAIASRPWYSSGCGGIVSRASSVSSESAASMSPRSTAAANRPTSSRSRAEWGRGACSRPPAGRRCVDRRACPLQRSFDGCFAGVEHLGHFGRAEAEHVAEHERGPLAGRQVLQRGHECETDRLSRLVAGLRSGSSVRERLRAGRRGRAPARSARSCGSARAARPSQAPPVGGVRGREARSGSGWSRSGRARRAARRVPRTRAVRARLRAASPARRPRHPGASRGFGSSAAAALRGTGRPARETRSRRPRGRGRGRSRSRHHVPADCEAAGPFPPAPVS